MRAVLVGFMGSGKTTIGQLLAKELQVSHVDLDQIIVEFAGKSINDIFCSSW
jgi:shikimate kinase